MWPVFGSCTIQGGQNQPNFVLWTGRIGANLREFRAAKGWSQRELAVKAHVSAETINKLEKGARPDVALSTMLKIQAALDLPSIELLLTGQPSFGSLDLAGEIIEKPKELDPHTPNEASASPT